MLLWFCDTAAQTWAAEKPDTHTPALWTQQTLKASHIQDLRRRWILCPDPFQLPGSPEEQHSREEVGPQDVGFSLLLQASEAAKSWAARATRPTANAARAVIKEKKNHQPNQKNQPDPDVRMNGTSARTHNEIKHKIHAACPRALLPCPFPSPEQPFYAVSLLQNPPSSTLLYLSSLTCSQIYFHKFTEL